MQRGRPNYQLVSPGEKADYKPSWHVFMPGAYIGVFSSYSGFSQTTPVIYIPLSD